MIDAAFNERVAVYLRRLQRNLDGYVRLVSDEVIAPTDPTSPGVSPASAPQPGAGSIRAATAKSRSQTPAAPGRGTAAEASTGGAWDADSDRFRGRPASLEVGRLQRRDALGRSPDCCRGELGDVRAGSSPGPRSRTARGDAELPGPASAGGCDLGEVAA